MLASKKVNKTEVSGEFAEIAGEDDEIFKIESKSKEEVDTEIQSARILRILDEMFHKVELALYLPYLIEKDGCILKKVLPKEDVHFILNVYEKYNFEEDVTDETLRMIISSDSARFQSTSLLHSRETAQDKELSQVLDILFSVHKLRNVNKLECKLPEEWEGFRCTLAAFKEVVTKKLSVTADEEQRRIEELTRTWKENEEAKILIETIKEKIKKQTDEFNKQMEARDTLISMYNEKIESIKSKFEDDVVNKVTESEKSMIRNTTQSEEAQIGLEEETKQTTRQYKILVREHMASEKTLRAKRHKAEAQLSAWLTKFDTDMGERQTEYETLTKECEDITQEMHELQVKLDEQFDEYTELMDEKEEYETKVFEAKAYAFLMNRSARIIQRAWREYQERKRLKKLAKKAKAKAKKGKKIGKVDKRAGTQTNADADKIAEEMDLIDDFSPDIP